MTRIEAIGATCAALAMAVFFALLVVTPALWLDLRSLQIMDAKAGQPVLIEYDRAFSRDFTGEWAVAIWTMDRGEWASYCYADGAWPYRIGTPTKKRDLAWLVDGDERCTNLPPGIYQAEVTVTANPGTVLARSESVMSNAFEVRP